jgi:hypothetical protein
MTFENSSLAGDTAMKKLFTSAAAIAVAGLIFTGPIVAQPGGSDGPRGYGWGPGMMMGPGMMGWDGRGGMGFMCDPRAAGLAEWRMERIERLVSPNEAQRTALNELRTASTKAAETIATACPREFPASASARLELMEKRLDAMLVAIKTVRPAFDAFYATLNDEQKARINSGGPRHWGWRSWRGE